MLEYLIKNGADLNSKTNDGNTVLMWAVWKEHEKVVKILVENGADKTAENYFGDTVFSLARGKNNQILIDSLHQ